VQEIDPLRRQGALLKKTHTLTLPRGRAEAFAGCMRAGE